jgi:hypothetical protein
MEFIENSIHWHQGVDKGNQLSRRWVPSQWTSITTPRPNIDLNVKLYCILGLHQLAREGDNVRESQTRPRNMERAYKIHHDNLLQYGLQHPRWSERSSFFWNLHEKPNIIGNMMTNELSYWYFATNENTSEENWDQRAKDVLCTRNT